MNAESDDLVVRRVRTDSRTPIVRQLKDTGKVLYVADKILVSAPRSRAPEAEVHFFKIGTRIERDEVLREEFARRNLCPADVDALIAVNRDDPLFSDTHPNATHWYDGTLWHRLAFRLQYGKRSVITRTNAFRGWEHFWWYAGIPIRDKRITMR